VVGSCALATAPFTDPNEAGFVGVGFSIGSGLAMKAVPKVGGSFARIFVDEEKRKALI
jgi:hypothetical protein